MPDVYPRTFSHIGLSVMDLDKAVRFYTEVMGPSSGSTFIEQN